MAVLIGEVITQADAVVVGMGHAPSTMWQYRWAWSQIEEYWRGHDAPELTEEIVASFLEFVAAEHREGRLKEWKRKLLRKAVLVLAEVSSTGTYVWKLSRARHRNEGLDPMLGRVQEQFERWLTTQGLAVATAELYATVSRTVLGWLPERGVTDVARLTRADVSAAVVFLGGRYQPGSMRTVLTALRVLCRFLEDTGVCTGLCRAVPSVFTRRGRPVSVLPADSVAKVVAAPDPATAMGRRNRAMLLLAARTGLRPSDIADLRLGDIDWRDSQITVSQHKTATVVSLPLLADAGTAIAEYLQHDRPSADAGEDHVFLRAQAPHIAFASSDLHHVASAAFARAGTVWPPGMGRGMRVLRASLATRMLENDTPLPVISHALGHRGIDSAKHYLATDEDRMRACCLDFIGIEPVALAGAVRL